jgi:esterase/lipase
MMSADFKLLRRLIANVNPVLCADTINGPCFRLFARSDPQIDVSAANAICKDIDIFNKDYISLTDIL